MKFFSTPAYSFGLKPKQSTGNGFNVGPGDYDIHKGFKNTHHQFAAYTISKAEREQQRHRDLVPGPGHYDGAKSGDALGSKFGKSKRNGLSGDEGPGPGYYDPKFGKGKGPSYSVGKASRANGDSDGALGPGQYHTNSKGHVPLGKFGKSTRGEDYQFSNPNGPGQYNSNKTTLGQKAGKFGKQTRDLKGKDDATTNLGPGAYNVSRGLGNKKGAGYSMARRYKGHDTGDTPGPGQYGSSFKNAIQTKGGFSFGRSMRNGLSNPDVPGPGMYSKGFKQAKTGGWTFGRAKRDGEGGNGEVPGPGQYSGKNIAMNGRTKGGFSFGTQQRVLNGPEGDQKNAGDWPAPGSYKLGDDNWGRGTKMGTGKRNNFASDSNPGPGSYNTGGALGGKGNKFGRYKGAGNKGGDGPGFYNIPSSIPDVAKYLLPEPEKRKIHL